MWMDSHSRHKGMCLLTTLRDLIFKNSQPVTDSPWEHDFFRVWSTLGASHEVTVEICCSFEGQRASLLSKRSWPFFLAYPTFPNFELHFLQESCASSPSSSVAFTPCQSEMVLTFFDKHLHLESQCGCPARQKGTFLFFLSLYELET